MDLWMIAPAALGSAALTGGAEPALHASREAIGAALTTAVAVVFEALLERALPGSGFAGKLARAIYGDPAAAAEAIVQGGWLLLLLIAVLLVAWAGRTTAAPRAPRPEPADEAFELLEGAGGEPQGGWSEPVELGPRGAAAGGVGAELSGGPWPPRPRP